MGLPTSQVGNWNKYYSEVLGIVNQPQQLFTRTGAQLTLNPAGTPMFDKSTIQFYNLYVTDSWHIKPTLTLTYGLGYQVETPPSEQNGKQVELVDSSGHPINFTNYFATKASMALQGQVYNPILGFSTIRQCHGREPQVSLQSVLRRREPPRGARLESEVQQRLAGQVTGRRQDRDSRRLWPDL